MEWWTRDRNHVIRSRVGVEGVRGSLLLLSPGVSTQEGKLENSFCGSPISKSNADCCSELIKFSGRSRQPHNAAYYSSRRLFQISVYAPPPSPPLPPTTLFCDCHIGLATLRAQKGVVHKW